MGDEFQGQRVNSRQAVERTAPDLGQQLVVAARQVGADLEKGLGNDVEIVEQPFGVGTETLPAAVALADPAVGQDQ